MPFDRQNYLLHLVPVGNRYLLARQRGIFPGKPSVLRKPEWDIAQPHRFGILPAVKADTDRKETLGLLDWLEDLHSSQVHRLFLSRHSNFPFVALNGLSNRQDTENQRSEPHQILWSYQDASMSLLPARVVSVDKLSEKKEGSEPNVDEMESLAKKLTSTLERCISFGREHRSRLAGWEESLAQAKELLGSRKANFSEYLYFMDPILPQKEWRLLRDGGHDKLDVAQTLFQAAELMPMLIEKRSKALPEMENMRYAELLKELQDVYLDCLIVAANRL